VRRLWASTALVLAAGLGLVVYGLVTPPHAHPPAPRVSRGKGGADVSITSSPALRHATAPASSPVSIAIPALRISSVLGPERGLTANGFIDDAPLSGPSWSLPWWYDSGPSPGQDGSAVILGHVDSAVGAGHLGVFFRLGNLAPGQRIIVALANGSVTRWVVTATVLYPDDRFPNTLVYARSGPPVLRLVTCGGTFDWQTHGYESVLVVTAGLAGAS